MSWRDIARAGMSRVCKRHLFSLIGILTLLGIALVAGVLWHTQTSQAGEDPRVTVEDGATGSVRTQSQTYAEEFPSTLNDYLGSAQRFTVFANTVTTENHIFGNIAAGTIVSGQGNDINTEPELTNQLPTGTGEDSDGRDVYYYQNVPQKIPKVSDQTNLNPKIVLGSKVSGINITKNQLPYSYNGSDLDQIANGQLFLEPADSTIPYINIASTLAALKLRSDAIADGQETNLTDMAKADKNVTIYDINNTGTQDKYGDNYESAYALKLTKKSSDGVTLLPGAVFALQYPIYPEHYTGTGTPSPTGWADMGPGVAIPVTDDNQNPVYDADGNLKTKPCNLYDADHNLIPGKTQYKALFTTRNGKYALTTDSNGEINVSVNVPSAYRFREIAAPKGYAMPTSLETDVTTFRTSTTPMARVFNIKWNEIFASGQGVTTGGNVYFLNMDLSKHAAPVQINIDFTGAPDDLQIGAPNVNFISPENSPSSNDDPDSQTFSDAVAAAPHMNIEEPSARATEYNKVLWNYKDAQDKTINVSSDIIYGTILAPATDIVIDRGHIYGSVIAKTVTINGGEIHRWDLSYEPWTSSTDKITNNRTVMNVPSTLPGTIDVNIKKQWQDLKDTDHADDKIQMQLYQQVTDPDGTTHTQKVDGTTLVTLSNTNQWKYTFKGLPTRDDIGRAIVYYASEENPPTGYSPVSVRGTPATDNQSVTITNTQFGFDLTKVASGSTTPLSGAEYELTDVTTGDAKTIKTTDQDQKPLSQIEPGTYLLKETKAPSGYQVDANYYALRLADHQTTKAENSDYRWQESVVAASDLEDAKGKLKDDSIWVDLPSKVTTGFATDADKTNVVHFIQADHLLPLTVTKVAEDGQTPLAGAEFTWQPVGGEAKTYSTNDDGLMTNASTTEFPMTPNVVYQLQESKAPTGYELNSTAIYVKNSQLVNADGSALTDSQQAALPATLKVIDKAAAMTFKDQPEAKPWQIKVIKVDSDSGDKLDGATFKLTAGDDSQTLSPTAQAGDTSKALAMAATYTLSEATPPDGYVSLDGDITIATAKTNDAPTITWHGQAVGTSDAKVVYQSVDDDAHLVTITVKDHKRGILPSTGGTGFLQPLLISLILLIAASVMFGIAWWQKRKAGEAA